MKRPYIYIFLLLMLAACQPEIPMVNLGIDEVYAIERMRRVLYEYKITGLKTNLSYLKRIMHTHDFVAGEYNTSFIEKNSKMLLRNNSQNEELENIAMIAAYIDYLVNLQENQSGEQDEQQTAISRWKMFGMQKGVLRI